VNTIDGFFSSNLKGVIIDLKGGLGNQLFEYAGGFSIAKRLNAPLFLVQDEENKSLHSDKDYRPLFKDTTFIERSDKKFVNSKRFTFEGDNVFGPFDIGQIPSQVDYIYIPFPYFQSYELIKDYIPEMRDYIIPELSQRYGSILEIDNESSAFIHVRRGDFLHVDNGKRVVPTEYFTDGMDILNSNGNIRDIYIISNDIAWCKQQAWNISKNVVFFDNPDELKTLYLMSQCWAGVVLSNSTFSLWGVFLGAYEKTDMIVYPTNEFMLKDLPVTWIKTDI
jgi:hypothetical protein